MVGRAFGEAGAMHGHRIIGLQGIQPQPIDHQLQAFAGTAQVGAPGIEAGIAAFTTGQWLAETNRRIEHFERVDLCIGQAAVTCVSPVTAAQGTAVELGCCRIELGIARRLMTDHPITHAIEPVTGLHRGFQ